MCIDVVGREEIDNVEGTYEMAKEFILVFAQLFRSRDRSGKWQQSDLKMLGSFAKFLLHENVSWPERWNIKSALHL